jgi:hypothetical protein
MNTEDMRQHFESDGSPARIDGGTAVGVPSGDWLASVDRQRLSIEAAAAAKSLGVESEYAELMAGFDAARLALGRLPHVCPVCGNKRCPKASDERLACTNSNEPGQAGSVFR